MTKGHILVTAAFERMRFSEFIKTLFDSRGIFELGGDGCESHPPPKKSPKLTPEESNTSFSTLHQLYSNHQAMGLGYMYVGHLHKKGAAFFANGPKICKMATDDQSHKNSSLFRSDLSLALRRCL